MSDAIKDWTAIVGWSTAKADGMPSLRVLSHVKGSLASRRKWARACVEAYGINGLAAYVRSVGAKSGVSIVEAIKKIPLQLSAVELRTLLADLGSETNYGAEIRLGANGTKVEVLTDDSGAVVLQKNGREPWKIVI
jgi:hypothetical protein